MTNPKDEQPPSIHKGFNYHGFGFHYAVIAEIERLSKASFHEWEFIGSEIPLSLHGTDIHADFILFNPSRRMYLVGECKRVNPAVARWCFARTKYRLGMGAPPLVDELYFPKANEDKLQLKTYKIDAARDVFQVGIALTTGQSGQGPPDRDAINNSVGQALRAANGFIQLCAENVYLVRKGFGAGSSVKIVPVVFTTAVLSTLGIDLSASDLASGHLPTTTETDNPDWIWFHHALTESMRARVQGRFVAEDTQDWTAFFQRASLRSVAIVSAGSSRGLAGFLDFLDTV
jgi:hypothetical protein